MDDEGVYFISWKAWVLFGRFCEPVAPGGGYPYRSWLGVTNEGRTSTNVS